MLMQGPSNISLSQHDMADALQRTWTDGRILMALYLADHDAGARLHESIAAADAINHAIPIACEIPHALTKAIRCGLYGAV